MCQFRTRTVSKNILKARIGEALVLATLISYLFVKIVKIYSSFLQGAHEMEVYNVLFSSTLSADLLLAGKVLEDCVLIVAAAPVLLALCTNSAFLFSCPLVPFWSFYSP